MEDTVISEAGSPPAGFLTPRSKVAKMLADMDNESTPSPPAPIASKPGEPEDQPVSNIRDQQDSNPNQTVSVPGVTQDQSEPEAESDDSEGIVRKPQGRAARRMLNKRSSPLEHPSSSPPRRRAASPQQSNDAIQNDEDDLYSATPMRPRERTRQNSPSPIGSQRGNGLFISPAKSNDQASEDELPSNPFGSKDKLAELVAQKRAERKAKEAEEKKRRKDSSKQPSSDLPEEVFEGNDDPVDPNIERIMSDASRPARKASKKALLEMERETQRLARQQALAHQMKVKKKFTTSDLFARFNFRQPEKVVEASNDQPPEEDTTASSAPNSDGLEERPKEPVSTPPSSPPTPLDRQQALVDKGALSKLVPVRQDSVASLAEMVDGEEELPDMAEILKSSQAHKNAPPPQSESNQPDKRGLKLARLGKKAMRQERDSSDDELDIVPALPAHLRAFEKATGYTRVNKAGDSRAIHNLKHLSHLHSKDGPQQKKGARPSINPQTLEGQLRKRAKEQARRQQLERIEELRAKGIEVQSVEERDREAEAFENLLEKARQDAVALRKAEKEARKEAGEDGAVQISDDEDEDEDYDGSGSEDEEMEEDGDEDDVEDNGLVDEAAEESDEEVQDVDEVEAEPEEPDGPALDDAEENVEPGAPGNGIDEGQDIGSRAAVTRKPRKSRIVMDEDDEIDENNIEHDKTTEADPAEESVDDPFAAFNFGAGDSANSLLSPTQAFKATMRTPTQASQEDSFDILRRIAPPSISSLPPTLPDLDTQTDDETQPNFVAGSQVPESQRVSLNWETQPPETPVPAGLNRGQSALSETPGWEPSQDAGFQSPWSVRARARRESVTDSTADHDTQSTVQLRVSESPAPSQNIPKRGKLSRRRAVAADDSDEDDIPPAASVKPEKRDAFREMARKRKEALTAVERAEADKEMRQMMDEAAEESDDEYAGLGGDDFVAPETEEDKEMIDSSHVDVDERAIAAHFAEKQRSRDEEETSRLYKDLTTGMLRKKMGANAFDLDEDEDELAVRRRQMRQLEEAKKRKALLKDENIATLAEGKNSKGKDAFLKAIADDDGDDDVINISDGEEESAPATQEESQSQQPAHRPLVETTGNKRRFPDEEQQDEERPPAKQRRTQASAFRRPTSLTEVKESVSFLLDEPNTGATFGPTALDLYSEPEEYDDESDKADESDDNDVAEEEARQNDGGFAPNPVEMEAKAMPPPRLPASQRRTAPKPAVVDRLSLKRGSSTSSDSALGRTAWAAGPTTGGFKVPSLLRRATTNTPVAAANDRGVTTPNLSKEGSGVKMGGTKKSSLAYQARAEERKAIVEASAKRREENTMRIAQLRRNSSMLNRGLTGRFE